MNTLKKNLLFVLLTPLLFGCNGMTSTNNIDTDTSTNEHVLTILKETRTTQYFSDDSVSLKDITAIIDAGRNATSGRNKQPWYFGAIINQEIIKEIAGTSPMGGPPPKIADSPAERGPMPSTYPKARFADAPAAIALACSENNTFSAGLACENMMIAATALGYGAKIVAGKATQLFEKSENREMLQIPDDMSVVAILFVGKPDSTIDMMADGVTGASDRKPLNEISIILK